MSSSCLKQTLPLPTEAQTFPNNVKNLMSLHSGHLCLGRNVKQNVRKLGGITSIFEQPMKRI